MVICLGVVTAVLLSAAADPPSAQLAAWEFDEAAFRFDAQHNIEVCVRDGVMFGAVTDSGGGCYLVFPAVDLPTPVRLEFRARTASSMADFGEIYWVTAESPGYAMDKYIRYRLQHDDRWHEYSVALPAAGRLRQVRLGFGVGSGEVALDHLRIVADPWPTDVQAGAASLPERVTIEDDALSVTLLCREHQYRITDRRTGRTWSSAPEPCKALLYHVAKADSRSLDLSLYDNSASTSYNVIVSLSGAGVLTFDIATDDPGSPLAAIDAYPPRMTADLDRGKLLFCDRSCGVFIDQSDTTYGGRLLEVYGNTSCADMPWIGVVDTARGDGVMTLIETPADAYFALAADAHGAHWPQVLWRPSLDALGYARRLSYRFSDDGGYVRLASLYRAYAESKGLVVPLRDRLAAKPAVAYMPGAPPIWGSTDVWQFVREARAYGIRRAILSNASHGLRDPASLRVLNEMGYITSSYDNFADIVDGPVGFGRDNISKAALIPRPGRGPQQGWAAYEHQMYERSSALALRALSRYVPEELEKYGYNGRFMDVSMAMSLHEDYHPDHTFDRRQDMAHRRGAFAYLSGLGLVLGTEHGNDWGADLVEYREGSMSGPFWWVSSGTWNAGMLTRPTSRADYSPEYLRYGHGYDTRIPLWELVYHDCQASTWYWGDSPGFHYAVAPEISERKDLFNLLYGTLPLLWRDTTDYDWRKNRDRFVRTYHLSTHFNRAVAFSRMTDHAFLTADSAVQRTRFDSGHAAVVNFGDTAYDYTTESGEAIMLAPRGFHVTGPGFHQSRTMVDDEPVLRIETEDFRLYETESLRTVGPVDVHGLVYAFRRDDGAWQLVLGEDATCTLRVPELTGWAPDQEVAAIKLDALSQEAAVQRTAGASDPLILTERNGDRFYSLVPLQAGAPARTVLHPPTGWIDVDQPVTLSCTDAAAAVRFTVDGTKPTLASLAYQTGFHMDRSGCVRAQAFRENAPVGEEVSVEYRVVRELLATDTMRGGDAPVRVEVPVEGYSELRILVTGGGDDCWSDRANLGEAMIIRADGSAAYLSDIDPVSHRQTYGELQRDRNSVGGPMLIAGLGYDRGIAVQSEAELRYALSPGDRRFSAWVGVDDSAHPADPNAPASHVGTVAFVIQGVLPPMEPAQDRHADPADAGPR